LTETSLAWYFWDHHTVGHHQHGISGIITQLVIISMVFLESSHSATIQIVAKLTEALDTALVYL